MKELSILIPARNEMFLSRTIEDILSHIEGDTEIITVLDGAWAEPRIKDDPRVTIIHHSESIGQRAATNEAARVSQARYLMKCDAHCAFDQGFDVKMMKEMQDDWTMVPTMRNLHVFNWVCKKCGDTRYQGPTPTDCPKCDNKTEFERDIVWIPKTNPQSNSYCFDSEPHFQYFGDYCKRPEGKGDLTETMSLQGSCFMCTRDKYWELNLCDEEFGSWGSQGIEVAVKTWLSGGRVMVNHKTWYAHLFRTQGGDFGFPYALSGNQVANAKKKAKELFFNNKWDKAIHPLSWLVEKFWPVRGWKDKDLRELKKAEGTPTKGILYYTDNALNMKIARTCREYIKKSGLPITSVSLKKMDFGSNIMLPLKRGYLTMFKQILAGLEVMTEDIVFFAEHDVLYSKEHFDFVPRETDTFYYNENVWFLRLEDGHALHYDARQLSGLCAYREPLIKHFRERVAMVEKEGFSRRIGFEPMTHNRIKWKNMYKAGSWKSSVPNIDIKHGANLAGARWKKEQFRNKKFTKGWTESRVIPTWGKTEDLIKLLT